MTSATPGTLEGHACHLGGLLGNFQSLEILIRIYLFKLPGARPSGVAHGVDLFEFQVGTMVDESDVTSYYSLGQLMDKFNARAVASGSPQIDRELVKIRDALAHGRVSAVAPSETLRLVKFGPPRQGKVRIEFNETLSVDWLVAQKRRVFQAIETVHAHMPPEQPPASL